MVKANINIKPRDLVGKKVKNLRKGGEVPVSLYGPKFSSANFMADAKELKKAFSDAGYSNFVNVTIDGGDKERCLIKEMQVHPVTDEILHTSFYVIDKFTEISADVPVVITGRSPIEDTGEGFVVPSLDAISVRCLPDKLPSDIQIDVTALVNIGDSITVADVALPEGVVLDSNMDGTTAVVYVSGIQKVEEEPVAAEPQLDENGNPIEPAEGEAAAEGEEGAEAKKDEE